MRNHLEIQQFKLPINFKTCRNGKGVKLFGYASIFNLVDKEGDVVLPGAFAQSLSQKPQIHLLWQHNPEEPIGKITEIYEDCQGLYIQAELLANIQRAEEAQELIKQSIIDSFSIGYRVIDSFFSQDSRFLKELELWEVSVVTFPANESAKFGWCAD